MLRAVLESIAFRVHDNLQSKELPPVKTFKADGGVTVNPQLMQLQADLLGRDVTICKLDTCWGVAKGVIRSLSLPQANEIESKVNNYAPNPTAQ